MKKNQQETTDKLPENYPSKDQINEWKEKHGKLRELKAIVGEEEFFAIVRYPQIKDIKHASASIMQKDGNKVPMNYVITLYSNCRLWDSVDNISKHTSAYNRFLSEVESMAEMAEGESRDL